MSLRGSAERIVRTLRKAGCEAYFVGGCVRDMVLGVEPHDFDIATSARPADIRELFDNTLEVGAKFGVMMVRIEGDWFEVATFRSDLGYSDGRRPDGVTFTDAKQDVRRRDFTINGLLYDPVDDEIIDYVGGRADIEAGIVRCIGDPAKRFDEDKLRLLRAVRFAARLEYEIEQATFEAIRAAAATVTVVSPERMGTELLHIFTAPHADRGLQLLDDSGLLEPVLPEVHAMKGVQQPEAFHPEGDVFEHTKIMLGLMDGPGPELALAVLLHDVGKPPTFTVTDRIRFNRHDRKGAEMAGAICRRLRMPRTVTDTVTKLVGTHMRFMDVRNMRKSRLKRWLRKPWFEDALELHRLDCLASHRDLSTWEWVKEQHDALEPEQAHPPRLLTGHDLIEMGFEPGPRFGEILADIEDAQLEGTVGTREEAIEFVHRQYGTRGQ